MQASEFQKASEVLKKAIQLSPLQAEKNLLQKKLELCLKKIF
jgi:hypothetical protein